MEIKRIKLPGVKTIIGVLSGKGGTGKTFVASCLAATLAKLGKKTGILDANISCPDIFKIFGVTQKIVPTADRKIEPAEKYGIKIVSMAGLSSAEDEPIVWRGPIVSKIIQQLLKETLWGELDALIIDFPSGTSDAVLTILQNFAVDGVLIVTTPQELSTLDARRSINMALAMKIPILGIIENMRGEVFGEGGAARVAETMRIPLLGSIPLRKQITALCDAGMPPVFQMEELEMIFGKVARIAMEKIMV
ncbi:Mrp/NBP35 family ATP-binding protein [Candidatus Peregrinibacteria bacterium]|nr:Mrp/NBP35 family ATP-binding protein [Candidatus Peregrinibacteria bacterium]